MASKFKPLSSFENEKDYTFLPFKFSHLQDDVYFLSNDFGEWITLKNEEFRDFYNKKLKLNSDIYYRLKSKNFLTDSTSTVNIELLASKYRTKNNFLESFSKLHIFVLTLRCNNTCIYCQASRKSITADCQTYDMHEDVLEHNVELFLSMPSTHLTLEFQGGESTLNMGLVRRAIELVNIKNKTKYINYVICTNLCDINTADLSFLLENNVSISTSLDGPKFIHDENRRFGKFSAYDSLVENLNSIKDKIGIENVSALMTTTVNSLNYPCEIIDEYVSLGFRNIFIRELNPYGFAKKYFHKIGYSTEDFLSFYKKCFDYIISLNKQGVSFQESYAGLILKKLLTPWSTGFVDLQSPCGAGFGVTLYNYDGNIYPSDESRMMAETGDKYFKMGNVRENSYEEIFFGDTMQLLASAGVNDALPVCSDCAYSPFCGADPVRRYQTTGSIFGHPGNDDFCVKNREIIKFIIQRYLYSDGETQRIMRSWGTSL
ncbi:His-Xaa-Ser system radical SAM maturase HxsB [Rahnella sp. AA]|uniref:His-Xaa-Ser system radical SAM maturase HxsB n=1 Tax=Rahnella sp. AA TaxID=2057180 RepID=UPI000C34F831|nr:His-Xaa-Ser system radical SAM maturase HxsB [Rahnella sp. AA]PKE29819.1 His-Xaa-Ser system radical SAM maturase HxsB [Rahnella sp. AA]